MIFQKLSTAAVLVLLLSSTAPHLRAQQTSTFYGLEEYLNRKMVGPEPVKIIIGHLKESRTNAPLDNLVAWAKGGFADLHDEHGIWKTDALGVKLGIVHSIHYYFTTSPPPDKSTRYLATLDELRRDDYISYYLAQMAALVVDESVLEKEVLQLLQADNPTLRAQGVLMGRPLAEEKRSLFERYQEMVENDDDAQVRMIILYSISGWRRKDVAYIAFERLVNDPDAKVRDWGARGLWSAADLRILTSDDLNTILPEMLKASDPFVRISIGRTAARLTTDRSLSVRTDQITDELLYRYLSRVRKIGSQANLAHEWLEWWTPLIPDYTASSRVVH
ncbi:MAG TPA: hypothetical protein VLB68_29205 [Pyrinomonadaceae bacterium]|nr:hypothetical protein [Pyrinomonadaceae bacterium]